MQLKFITLLLQLYKSNTLLADLVKVGRRLATYYRSAQLNTADSSFNHN